MSHPELIEIRSLLRTILRHNDNFRILFAELVEHELNIADAPWVVDDSTLQMAIIQSLNHCWLSLGWRPDEDEGVQVLADGIHTSAAAA